MLRRVLGALRLSPARSLSNALYNQDDASLLMLESREQEKVMYRPNQVEAVAAQMAGRQPKFDAV